MISTAAELRLVLLAAFAAVMYMLFDFSVMIAAVILVLLWALVKCDNQRLLPALGAQYRPYVNGITTEHLIRPDPLPEAPYARRTIKFEDVMAPIRNDKRIDHHARHMELMAVARDPLGGNPTDFETNKRWIDATNQNIADAGKRVRPDMHIVYDDDDAAAAGPQQTLPVPFTPPHEMNTALASYDRAASREWAAPLLSGGVPGLPPL